MTLTATTEIEQGNRFSFGDNWTRFLENVNEDRIQEAEKSLQDMLGLQTLSGKIFLDIGSGSGLFSLAARRLGACVHSFDFDPKSVNCTQHLRDRFFPNDNQWVIEQGSILDQDFLKNINNADIVYSWGVLHHTGAMWEALENAANLVKSDGQLFIAIYNDEEGKSRRWKFIKKTYNKHPWTRPFLLLYGAHRAWTLACIKDLLDGKPFHRWRSYKKERGMSPWRDVEDWVGGYPFEVASPAAIFNFYHARGFNLTKMITRYGYGCNEFVFKKTASSIRP